MPANSCHISLLQHCIGAGEDGRGEEREGESRGEGVRKRRKEGGREGGKRTGVSLAQHYTIERMGTSHWFLW